MIKMGRPYPRKVKIVVPRYPPDRLEGLLELIFPDHPLRQELAKAFLEELRERGKEGLSEEEWITFIIRFIGQEHPKEARTLMELYDSLEGKISRTRLQEEIVRKAKELGLMEGGSNLFNVIRGQYVIVVKVLRKLGMVYKKEGFYYTSPHFGEVLESIGRLWKDWRAGLVE